MASNFYEILGLPTYASIGEVRSSFKKLAVRYHPDKNPGDRVAEERFKEISNAYNVLGDVESKQDYDLKLSGLRSFSKKQEQYDKEEKRRRMRAELLRRRKEAAEKKIIDDWEKMEKGGAYHYRLVFNYALIVTGVLFLFKNWFYTIDSFAPGYLIFGVVFILIGNVRLQNINYTRWLYLELRFQKTMNISRRIVRNLLTGITLSLVVGIVAAHGMALYHFTYYSAVTEGKILVRSVRDPSFAYRYEVDGKEYIKALPENYFRKHIGEDSILYVRVRYSQANPVFAKIIEE